VRGTAVRGIVPPKIERFIPACAGNGGPAASATAMAAVHPRVCGERLGKALRKLPWDGSSPRVRGTGCWASARTRSSRFIPACAGNGLWACPRMRLAPVHPRVCGERRPAMCCGGPQRGSSPRVRGTGTLGLLPHAQPRFIPACAGNGASTRPRGPATAVHPRVCGERANALSNEAATPGSSPRVRGTEIPF